MQTQLVPKEERPLAVRTSTNIYTQQELDALREFVRIVKDDTMRKDLVCWGDHSEYSKGY